MMADLWSFLHNQLFDWLDFAFMRQALVASLALSIAAPPLGVFLMMRGMSLIGDAMSHAILPGIALGFYMAAAAFYQVLSWPEWRGGFRK